METASTIVGFCAWYGGVGLAAALVFVFFGIDRIDENASGAYMFRPLLIPGAALIWPIVLWRWALIGAGRDDWALRHRPPRRSHGIAALAFAVAIPATILLGLAIKQTWPADVAPVRIEGPAQ